MHPSVSTQVDVLSPFLRTHQRKLKAICARWARGSGADSEDLLAEATLRALLALRQGTAEIENPLGWWSTIIANVARDRHRARARKAEELHALSSESTESRLELDAVLVSRRRLAEVLTRLDALAPSQRAALVSRTLGEEYATIAEALGTSATNARKLVQVARASLRECRARRSERTRCGQGRGAGVAHAREVGGAL